MPRLRDMANEHPPTDREPHSLTQPARRYGMPRRFGMPARAALLPVVLAIALTGPCTALAADPTSDPAATAQPATCADRFPAEGPAGVDLRLGCIIGEVVGLYVPSQAEPPVPASSYAILVALLVLGVLVVIWLAMTTTHRLAARFVGRRLAPVLPGEWWVCAKCKSVNGANVGGCYSCGARRPDGPALMTDDQPAIPQSFGRKRKSG